MMREVFMNQSQEMNMDIMMMCMNLCILKRKIEIQDVNSIEMLSNKIPIMV